MLQLPLVLFFVALTFSCWGIYGPTLHLGQEAMGHSLWRPFICVGVAYFVVAVVAPWIMLRRRPEAGEWTIAGILWSFIAGAVGALGALGIIVAFKSGGRPVFVMPLVFGCAPVVNTFVTMAMNRTHRQASLIFYTAVAITALGAAGVFVFKPSPATARTGNATPSAPASTTAATEAAISPLDGGARVEADAQPPRQVLDWLTSMFAIAVTALCWGSYGPLLHRGQAQMQGSRLRPFICVGLAYFAIAVLVPGAALLQTGESGHWSLLGAFWSLAAGAAGALGALGVILAFNFGGKPVFVMPLVFGGAPIVNTLASMLQSYLRMGSVGQIKPLFLGSLAMVIAGAVCVLVFAPRGGPAHAPSAKRRPQTPEPPSSGEAPTSKTPAAEKGSADMSVGSEGESARPSDG